MKLTEILQNIGSPIAFHPDLVILGGSTEAAIFLCQLGYWTGKQHDPDGWIHKTQEEWFYETSLTKKQQRSARKKLVKREYIEEREIGSPARLQYRLNVNAISAIWNAWVVVITIKNEFQDLISTYGILMSRGILNYEIKNQLENYRSAIEKCHAIANRFFEDCEKMQISPLEIIDQFQENLTKVAQTLTLTTGLKSQRDIQVDPKRTYKYSQKGHTSTPQKDIQVDPNGTLPPPSNPVWSCAPAPSKTTAKTTPDTSQESTQAAPDLSLCKSPSLNFSQEKKNKEADKDFVQTVEVEVLQDTQQDREDKQLNSQGQDCIFMKKNIPGARGGENSEISEPNWVQEYEDKVRLGQTLPRSELLALAEYRLGDYASLYRDSGRVLDASPNDIKPEFLKFLQWHSFDRNPDITFVRACVKKAEQQPERWEILISWLEIWQQVQSDPSVLETMLKDKVSSAGKKANGKDFELQFDLAAKKSMSVKNWWEVK